MFAAQIQLLQETLKTIWLERSWLSWLLWPLSLVLGVWVLVRRWLYRLGLISSYRIEVPIVVVGNVVAGGVGKTPVVMATVSHLIHRGFRPGVISRGYGRQTSNCREVFVNSIATDVGDEPVLIKRTLSVPVFVATRRVEAAQALLKAYPNTNVIVCDDGLQHLALQRDIEVCVFDDRGPGNGFLLPAGPLREPWPKKVDLVIHTGHRPAFPGFRARRKLQSKATRMDGSLINLSDLCSSNAPPILAVAGIAQPENFFAMLRALGLQLAGSIALPDHFDFSHWQRPRDQDYCLVCTEKDAIKLWASHPDALSVRLDCELDAAFLHELEERLEQARRARLSSNHGHTTS